jgi:hypothetical protein
MDVGWMEVSPLLARASEGLQVRCLSSGCGWGGVGWGTAIPAARRARGARQDDEEYRLRVCGTGAVLGRDGGVACPICLLTAAVLLCLPPLVQLGLQVGQLITGEAFSLFEAMSAMEAGNPKMDAGAAPAAASPALETLLADLDTAAPLTGLSNAQLIRIMDTLLVMEASWHTGASVMQTVYSCLYMLALDRRAGHLAPPADS